MITVQKLLDIGLDLLEKAGIATFSLEAELIIADILEIPRLELFFRKSELVNVVNEERIRELFKRRSEHQPLQYLLEKAYFRDLELTVGPGVLIPRPETELILDILKDKLKQSSTICDVGTGSGAIILAIASEFSNTMNIGIDKSSVALEYAKKNKANLKLDNVELVQGDLLKAFDLDVFDIIIANLPYISDEEYQKLPKDVLEFEPKSALVAGVDGLDDIRELIVHGSCCLKRGGVIIFEIGERQSEKVVELLEKQAIFKEILVKKDLNFKNRFVLAVK